MTIKELKCPNCGGTVDRKELICHYCGTQFVRNDDTPTIPTLRVEHYSSPVRIFERSVSVPKEHLIYEPENVEKFAKSHLAEKLAEALLEGNMVEFTSEMNWTDCEQVISARLRVVERGYRF